MLTLALWRRLVVPRYVFFSFLLFSFFVSTLLLCLLFLWWFLSSYRCSVYPRSLVQDLQKAGAHRAAEGGAPKPVEEPALDSSAAASGVPASGETASAPDAPEV